MNYYDIEHTTMYRYSAEITESVMELRMQPRSDAGQQCLSFELVVRPKAQCSAYVDELGNTIHTFNIPTSHQRLYVKVRAVVAVQPVGEIPEALADSAWSALDALRADPAMFDYLAPSRYTQPSALLDALREELGVVRDADPLTVLRRLNGQLHRAVNYVPDSTEVDSPIDHVLETRAGVCQDYAQVLIAVGRGLGIPCRYVSGHLFHRPEDHDISAEDASHAWMEAYLPELGWVGFDPTNDVLCSERHIRVAVGRDYSDVPPTHGVFKGKVTSDLTVKVQTRQLRQPPGQMMSVVVPPEWEGVGSPGRVGEILATDLQQQQQQQQQ